MPKYQPDISAYNWTVEIPTRVTDNGGGHLNNALFYAFYDEATVIMLNQRGCNIPDGRFARLVVQSSTEYLEPVPGWPEPVTIAIGVRKLGRTSMDLEFGVFQGPDRALAVGRVSQVWMDKETYKPTDLALTPELRASLSELMMEPQEFPSKL